MSTTSKTETKKEPPVTRSSVLRIWLYMMLLGLCMMIMVFSVLMLFDPNIFVSEEGSLIPLLGVVFLATLLIGFVFSKLVFRRFAMPISEMQAVVKAIREKKDLAHRAKVYRNDELGHLMHSFNQMLDGLEENHKTLYQSQQRLNMALWGSNEGLWDWNISTDDLYLDERVINHLGYTKKEIHHDMRSFMGLFHPDEIESVKLLMKNHLNNLSDRYEVEQRVRSKEGEWKWLLTRGKVVKRDRLGKAMRMTGTMLDISLRKEAEEGLNLFGKIFENTTEGVVVLDDNFRITTVNPAFENITGYMSDSGSPDFSGVLDSEQHGEEFYSKLREKLKKTGHWQGEVWGRRKDDEIFPVRLNISSVKESSGKIKQYVCVFSDITQHKRAEDELRYLANYDPLTGLPNRTLFLQHLSHSLDYGQRHGTMIALLFCDLDHFKHINDSLGHAVGDLLLQEAAKRFRQCVRDTDTVARLGGDEFTILLDDMRDERSIVKVANSIINAFSKIFTLDGHELAIGTTIGISVSPEDGEDSSTLLKNADTAMYHAKQQGRNTYQFYRQEMNQDALERRTMENHLRKALERNELELYYQPKVDMHTGEIVGVEALIRWHHPGRGLVSPAYFIPLAEETGLIIPIGQWVLTEACRQNKLWREAGHPLIMAVNLSAYQFRTGDLAEMVAEVLWETGLDPAHLELELTESLVMENAEKSVLMLRVLGAMGISVSIDDFGTGYSSLSYLKRFPVDTIKIDQSFVQDVTNDPEDAAIVIAIIAMARSLQLKVVAEGVETREQLDFLHQQDCDTAQGYLFSKPVPADEFTELLKQHQQGTPLLPGAMPNAFSTPPSAPAQ